MRLHPFALSLWLMLGATAAHAATPGAPYRAFVSSCVDAFERSGGSDSEAAGRRICECTSKESRFQGVSVSALKRETAKIQRDPAYKIQDENLMNAFRWCAIQAMKAADLDRGHHAK